MPSTRWQPAHFASKIAFVRLLYVGGGLLPQAAPTTAATTTAATAAANQARSCERRTRAPYQARDTCDSDVDRMNTRRESLEAYVRAHAVTAELSERRASRVVEVALKRLASVTVVMENLSDAH